MDLEEQASRPAIRRRLLGAALAIWALATFGHGWGLAAAGVWFEWSRTPGNLHPDGGSAGLQRADLLLTALFSAGALAVIGTLAWRWRRLPRQRLADCGVPWLLWGSLLFLVWKCCVLFGTELVHFAQYALVGGLLSLALDRGRRPQAAFLIATGLGALDEIWQHYGLALWLGDNRNHALDWSDLILNALGTCGGVLVVVTGARARGEELMASTRLLYRSVVTLAVALLPLLLLDDVTWARLFGFYWHHPFWAEFENNKAVHWLTPGEGIPLCIAAVLVLGLAVEPRRHTGTLGVLSTVVLLAIFALDPPTRREGRPIHWPVPQTDVVKVADGAVTIDGRLDEAAWQRAERLGPFVATLTGRDVVELPGGTTVPLLDTHARLLWDERALYVAFEVVDADIWGRRSFRDDPRLAGDEVVHVFIDNGGDEVNFFEFELSPLNAVLDYYCRVPFPPMDYNPWAAYEGLIGWSAPDIESAVAIDGEVDVVEWPMEIDVFGGDRGWTAELAIPWGNFATTMFPKPEITVGDLPPRIGERWRINLCRSERPRAAGPGMPPYQKPEFNQRGQFQAWSPGYNSAYQKPSHFGSMRFVEVD